MQISVPTSYVVESSYLILLVICVSTSDSVRHRIIVNLYANMFIRVCISKHGCISTGTNLCTNAIVLMRVLVFIYAALLAMTHNSTCCIDVGTNLHS